MFVAYVIETFAEVEHLLSCRKHNFHRPSSAVVRGELAHVRLFLRLPAIWSKETSLEATELSRDWRKLPPVNLQECRKSDYATITRLIAQATCGT